MTDAADKERVHTYLDDIKFQSVKGNNRRTSFVSTDHQIVAKNAQAIRDIEKRRRLTTADFRRQENAYLQKLQKLHQMKDQNRRAEISTSGERRHSAPTVFWAQMAQSQPPQTAPSSLKRTNTNLRLSADKSQSIRANPNPSSPPTSSSSHIDQHSTEDSENPSSPLNMLVRMMYCRPSPEARRMSFDIQQETTREAMKKLDLIVTNHKRRATIAEGDQSDFFSLVGAKNNIVDRSLSTGDDECFG